MPDDSQILNLTAVLVAAKFEETEVGADLISRMVSFAGGTCSKEDFIKMEVRMLRALDFRIWRRTPARWRRRLNSGVVGVVDLE